MFLTEGLKLLVGGALPDGVSSPPGLALSSKDYKKCKQKDKAISSNSYQVNCFNFEGFHGACMQTEMLKFGQLVHSEF